MNGNSNAEILAEARKFWECEETMRQAAEPFVQGMMVTRPDINEAIPIYDVWADGRASYIDQLRHRDAVCSDVYDAVEQEIADIVASNADRILTRARQARDTYLSGGIPNATVFGAEPKFVQMGASMDKTGYNPGSIIYAARQTPRGKVRILDGRVPHRVALERGLVEE